MPESVLVKFNGELLPGITLRDLVNAIPLFAIKKGLLTVEKENKKNIFNGKIMEIEGLPNLKLEQAFELTDATAERSCAGSTILLSQETVQEYLRSNICLLEKMIESNYEDSKSISRRIKDMKNWLKKPSLIQPDLNAQYEEIIEIDLENQIATVEPGVVNLELSQKVKENGLFYAPDPASQRACTLGGNIAENSGGPHCLAYGVTTNHVLGMEVVLSDGTINFVGSRSRDYIGYDLRGIIIGSEGTLAVVTKIIVKLMRIPEAVKTLLIMFDDETKATDVVSKIISTGIVPSALEMMDRTCVRAADEAFNLGYPQDIDAVLIIEVDG